MWNKTNFALLDNIEKVGKEKWVEGLLWEADLMHWRNGSMNQEGGRIEIFGLKEQSEVRLGSSI